MAIPIIGASSEEPQGTILPDPPERELPDPEQAPAAHRVLNLDAVVELLEHSEPLVRVYALEQLGIRYEPRCLPSVERALADPDDGVCAEALRVLLRHRVTDAAARIEACLLEAQGRRAADLATALGELAPGRLLPAVSARGRLDDEAHRGVVEALAGTDGAEVRRYFEKALSRARMLGPERRKSLYGAIFHFGDVKLCRRALGEAIGDSNLEAPEGASYPTRAALADVGGFAPNAARLEHGELIYRAAAQDLEGSVGFALSPSTQTEIEVALREHRSGDSLRALAPLSELAVDGASPRGQAALRWQGLLAGLIERANDIDKLGTAAGALFVAVALRSAAVVSAETSPEPESPALLALAKALETEATQLSEESLLELTARFKDRSPREMRRVHTILAREQFRRLETFERYAKAAIDAGHAVGLLSAVAESGDEGLLAVVADKLGENLEPAESAVLSLLNERPLEPAPTRGALVAAVRLRTERTSLAVGRRFVDLRGIDKGLVAQALAVSGDPRFLPLLRTRAFADEPEEAALTLLSLVGKDAVEGTLQEALQRLKSGPSDVPVRVELQCGRCEEVGIYGFRRAFVDPNSEDPWGDPVFEGEAVCKACGARDQLRPTPAGGRVLTELMVRFLEDVQRGRGSEPLVSPAEITVEGQKVGLAEGLRRLATRIQASPERIGLRITRASLYLLLRRTSDFDEELSALREVDPNAVEAVILEGRRDLRDGHLEDAKTRLLEAHERLSTEPPPRIYDWPSPEAARNHVEDHLLELEARGVSVGVDLRRARERSNAERERQAEARARAQAPSALSSLARRPRR